jgi:hypothetical protein
MAPKSNSYPAEVITTVKALRAEGKSHRQIREATGLTAYAIASLLGHRWTWKDREKAAMRKTDLGKTPERCPGCRGMVYMPCRVCAVRHYKKYPEQYLARAKARQISITEAVFPWLS